MKTEGIVSIHGNNYVTVARRVYDFRQGHPAEDGWSITTEIISLDPETVVMKASIIAPGGTVVGTGFAEESRASSQINRTSALENCETSCIGRALFAATAVGFAGSSQYASADEVQVAIAQQKAKPVGAKGEDPRFDPWGANGPGEGLIPGAGPLGVNAEMVESLRTEGAPTTGAHPLCPQCGGPMWDNRDRPTGPDWKCKAGKWNKETQTTDGCDGHHWKDAEVSAMPVSVEKVLDAAEEAFDQVPF